MAYQPGDYPLPSHALYVWLDGETLRLGVPPQSSNDRGHTLSIPIEKCSIEFNESGSAPLTRQLGWDSLLRLLRERARESAKADHLNALGHATSPVQDQLDKWLKAMGGPRKFTSDGHHVASVEELGELEI